MKQLTRVIMIILAFVAAIVVVLIVYHKPQGAPSGPQQFECSVESRGGACAEIYQPACGWFNPEKIQCIKYPCAQTFGNGCHACQNENVKYYTIGQCPE